MQSMIQAIIYLSFLDIINIKCIKKNHIKVNQNSPIIHLCFLLIYYHEIIYTNLYMLIKPTIIYINLHLFINQKIICTKCQIDKIIS